MHRCFSNESGNCDASHCCIVTWIKVTAILLYWTVWLKTKQNMFSKHPHNMSANPVINIWSWSYTWGCDVNIELQKAGKYKNWTSDSLLEEVEPAGLYTLHLLPSCDTHPHTHSLKQLHSTLNSAPQIIHRLNPMPTKETRRGIKKIKNLSQEQKTKK